MRAQMKPSGMLRLHLKSVPKFSIQMTSVSRVKALLPGMQKAGLGTLACTPTDADEVSDDPLSLHRSAVQWQSRPH